MGFKCVNVSKLATLVLSFLLVTSLSSEAIYVPCPPKSRGSSSTLPKNTATCTRDVLKFGVCGSWLGLVTEVIGTKPSEECCTVVKGLADLEAAVCLCSAVKADVLGVVKLQVPIAISAVLNSCGKKIPHGFTCA